MIYGIDLGTTNSLLALKGELITGLVPSIADLDKGQAGESLRKDYKALRSFKVDITNNTEGTVSKLASALVLKELVRLGKEQGHDVKEVVISVPAYFNDSQRSATQEAAESIGLTVRALINEPTAAAIAIGHDIKAQIAVFDLGGGTFDISIVDSRYGDYDVIAFDGLRIGGDDLDKALLDFVISKAEIKAHRAGVEGITKLRSLCEEAKKHISTTKTDAVIDISEFETVKGTGTITITTRIYDRLVSKVFGPCITKLKEVTHKYVAEGEEFELAMVGGSTHCPYLKKYVENQIGKQSLDTHYNRDTVVALGASIYAEMIENGEAEYLVSDVTKALSIGLDDGTCRIIVPPNSKLPYSNEVSVTNPVETNGLLFNLFQGDSLLAENNEQIGQLKYPLKKVYKPNKFKGWATIDIDTNGRIEIGIREPLKEPVKVAISHKFEVAK